MSITLRYILRLLHFYRAMLCLRGIMLSSSVRLSVRPSVCLSVTSRYCSETTRRNQLGFAVEASFHLSHTTRISKNYGTSLWGFVPDSGLRKFRQGQVDRIVNNIGRRRRRSSLLTTPIRQSTSRGFLLQVDQL